VASEFLLDGDTSHIENTIIDGSEITDTINGSIVNFVSGEDTTSVLCGFTIQHGKGTIYTTPSNSIKGGGGIFLAGSGAKIIYNHITENHLSDTLPDDPPMITGAAIHTKVEMSEGLWIVVAHNTIDHNSCESHLTEASDVGLSIWCNARIMNNIISWNSAIGTGSAYAVAAAYSVAALPDWSTTGTAIVENNMITNNFVKSDLVFAHSAGGFFQAITGTLENNYIAYNVVETFSPTWGGCAGFLAYGPKEGTVVRGNTFKMNISNANGGALGFQPISEVYQVLVENNYFIENEGYIGGAMSSFGTPVIMQNNVLSGNSALRYGGGIYVEGTQTPSIPHYAILINNSFSENKANWRGGAIFTTGLNPVIINSIFWNDSSNVIYGPEIYLDAPDDTLEIAHSNINFELIKGKTRDGGGNINEDPLYEDLNLLTLLSSSPCIDSGIAIYTCDCGETHTCPWYDITGTPRPQSSGIEMGAYEIMFAGTSEVISNPAHVSIYPNPFSKSTMIEYEVELDAQVKLAIYNHLGQQVEVLVTGQQNRGKHQINWNAEGLPSGIYFYRLTTGSRSSTGKMVVVK